MSGEQFKGAVHYVAGALAMTMALYNFKEWAERREPRFLVNGCLYALSTGWELKQTLSHTQP